MGKFLSTTGFSIEIEGFKLILSGTHKGLPLYESIGGIVTAIAIVREPALKELSLVITKKKNKKNTVMGPIMIPDKYIYRFDSTPKGIKEEYFCFFSAITIEKLKNSYTGKIKIGH